MAVTEMMDRGERLEVGVLYLVRVPGFFGFYFCWFCLVLTRRYHHLVKPANNIEAYRVKSKSFSSFISPRGNLFSVSFQR